MQAPIILFTYNRPFHTRKTIESLVENELADQSDFFVYSDGPRSDKDMTPIQEIRDYVQSVKGFKSVTLFEQSENRGIARSVIKGVSETINKHGRVIVMEDDLISSPYFLRFLNEALDYYANEPKVFSISGYNHPPSLLKIPEGYPHDMFFSYRNASCGWGTWADCWNKADWEVSDFDTFKADKNQQQAFNRGGEDMSEMLTEAVEGKIDSWAIRWSYTHFLHNALSVYPVHSYIDNIGHDGTGINSYSTNKYDNDLSKAVPKMSFLEEPKVEEHMAENFRQVYKRSLFKKFKRKIRKTLFQ